jgi:hypothetical protein
LNQEGNNYSLTEKMSSIAPSEPDRQTCNTCLEEKPITSFKTNGLKSDGSHYRMKKCRQCLVTKVNPRDDDEGIRKMKLAVIERALKVSERAMELVSEI